MDRHFLSTSKAPEVTVLGSGFLRLQLCGIRFPRCRGRGGAESLAAGRKVEVRRGAAQDVVTGGTWGLAVGGRQCRDRARS